MRTALENRRLLVFSNNLLQRRKLKTHFNQPRIPWGAWVFTVLHRNYWSEQGDKEEEKGNQLQQTISSLKGARKGERNKEDKRGACVPSLDPNGSSSSQASHNLTCERQEKVLSFTGAGVRITVGSKVSPPLRLLRIRPLGMTGPTSRLTAAVSVHHLNPAMCLCSFHTSAKGAWSTNSAAVYPQVHLWLQSHLHGACSCGFNI